MLSCDYCKSGHEFYYSDTGKREHLVFYNSVLVKVECTAKPVRMTKNMNRILSLLLVRALTRDEIFDTMWDNEKIKPQHRFRDYYGDLKKTLAALEVSGKIRCGDNGRYFLIMRGRHERT